jgi:hypothetical protein
VRIRLGRHQRHWVVSSIVHAGAGTRQPCKQYTTRSGQRVSAYDYAARESSTSVVKLNCACCCWYSSALQATHNTMKADSRCVYGVRV